MIKSPYEVQTGPRKIRMLIAGFPGIGKTTLALSSPRPLHIDVDFGLNRIAPYHRTPYIQPSDYQELLDELTEDNLKGFETLVFDTGGKLFSLISLWAVKQNTKNALRDGALSIAGYGFVGREFQRLFDFCFYELGKNIVFVFHTTEEKDGEETKWRIKVDGKTKTNIWEPMDLGGFIEMSGTKRRIGFDNCERYFAKGTRSIHGYRDIPTLSPNGTNDFLTKLFDEYNESIEKETRDLETARKDYNLAMEEGGEIISSIADLNTALDATSKLGEIKHRLTSREELWDELYQKATKLGLKYDKQKKQFVAADDRA